MNQLKWISIHMNQSKRGFIQMKNNSAKKHKIKNRSDNNSDLLIRSINKSSLIRNISTLNQLVSVKWYDAMNENCLSDRWDLPDKDEIRLSDRDDIDWNDLIWISLAFFKAEKMCQAKELSLILRCLAILGLIRTHR